jgi:hypothetical protein
LCQLLTIKTQTMKKIAAIAAVALIGVIVLPSCKKDYTCVCTTTIAGAPAQTSEFSLGKQSKKDAEAACSAKVTTGGVAVMECKLK